MRITARWIATRQPFLSEHRENGRLAGLRLYSENGILIEERPLLNGKLHGVRYQWHDSGSLSSAVPWEDGLEHGTARQWTEEGKPAGCYRMRRGTGWDLWWTWFEGQPPFLAEARYIRRGAWHGPEWWLNANGDSVFHERFFCQDRLHGIERLWNAHGRMRRGYPKYWIHGQQTTRRRYLAAALTDPSLPPLRTEDNSPQRSFPPLVARAISRANRVP